MKRILYIIGLIILSLSIKTMAKPQTDMKKNAETRKPDFVSIKRETLDPKSRYYYPELMKRYERNETIMNLDDYRYLYLGTIFQEDYNPYRKSANRDKIRELYYRTEHTRPELDSIITYAQRSLEDDPFDLEQINYLIYALRGRGKNNTANIWQYRLNHLLQAIISTGTGLDTANAWYIINPRHEYNIINFQGRTAESQEFIEPYYEYIRLSPSTDQNSKTPDGYYFNIHHLLEEYYKKYPDQY